MDQKSRSDTMGRNRETIFGAIPKYKRESGETVKAGIRLIADTETVWIFGSRAGRANHRKPVLSILRRAARISDGSTICTVIVGRVPKKIDR